MAPTYADVLAAYPPKARHEKAGGRATLFCDFTRRGDLAPCRTITEEPRGMGFAGAAQKLADKFRAYTATADGKGLRDASVQLPVTFDPKMLDGSSEIIGKPQFAVLPTPGDVHAAFANAPKGIGSVRVTLNCVVQQAGWMGDCKVASEDPPDKGLGPAALALASKVRVITWTSEGLPVVGAHINLPIRYESGAPPAAAAPPAKTP